ncbi:MAG: hypothetical protein ABI666_09300 [Ferruginibacter sp.]
MIKRLSVCLFIFSLTLFSSGVFASPQMPDYIIFKGDTIATYNLILEQYLQRHDTTKTEQLFGLSFRNSTNGSFSFNCWRGYQAIYKIDNDSLFLVDIINCGERRNGKIDKAASFKKMKEVFGNGFINDRVYINWFSGDLNFPLTNKVLRWDGVFYKIYEKETVVNISNGKVSNIEHVNNYEAVPNAKDRKDKSKVSDTFFEQLKKIKWKKINEFCAEDYIVTIDKEGKVSKVTMRRYQNPDTIEKYWDRAEYDSCIHTIFNSLRKLRFDILKDKGKPISEDIYIGIWYDSKKRKIIRAV